MVRSLATAARNSEEAAKALQRSTLPMGPKLGINLVTPGQWESEMKESYVPPPGSHLLANLAMAGTLKAMFTGPTASAGKVATLVDDRGRLVKY